MKIKALLLAVLMPAVQLLAGDVKIQSDRWMPINGTPQEEPPGYGIELIVEIFTEKDDVTYTLEPWSKSIENTTKGTADAIIGAAKDEAPNLIFPKEPVAHINYGLWAKTTTKFEYSAEALTKVKIGVIKGYTYWPELDKLIQDNASNIVIFGGDNPLEDAIDALNSGKIDLFPESKPVFAWAVKEQELSPNDFVSTHSHDGGYIYVAFTKSDRGKELAAQWDAGIDALRKSGVLAKILGRYDVTDWKK